VLLRVLSKPNSALVFGSSGFMGSELCSNLLFNGFRVRTIGRSPSNDYRVALTDCSAIRAVIEATKPTHAVNLVALTDVDMCERAPDRAREVNCGLLECLARLASFHSFSITQISTDQVYGGVGPHSEKDDTRPINVYGRTKVLAERFLDPKRDLVIRTSFVGKSRALRHPSWTDWLVTMLSAGRSVSIDSRVKFSPLHVRAVCNLVSLSIRYGLGGTYNLGSCTSMTKIQFASRLASSLRLDASLILGRGTEASQGVAPRPLDLRLDSSKFEAALNVKLPIIEETLNQTCQDYGESHDQ